MVHQCERMQSVVVKRSEHGRSRPSVEAPRKGMRNEANGLRGPTTQQTWLVADTLQGIIKLTRDDGCSPLPPSGLGAEICCRLRTRRDKDDKHAAGRFDHKISSYGIVLTQHYRGGGGGGG